MLVKREIIDKNPHIITDYMYNGDNIGINLNSLNNEKSNKIYSIPSLLISDDLQTFDFTENEISLSANLKYNSDKVQAIINVTTPDDYYTINKEISDEDFAKDLINVCLKDKKSIKKLPSYESTIQEVINNMKEEALSNNYLIRENEMKYKCYIYSDNMELLGIANRLLSSSNKEDYYIIGEYIGKSLEKLAADRTKIIIDICVNDEITLQLTNACLITATNTSVAYAEIDSSFAKIKRIDATYESIKLNIPKNIALPNHNVNYNPIEYLNHFTSMNERSEIINFYKLNKPNMTQMININKYLIG